MGRWMSLPSLAVGTLTSSDVSAREKLYVTMKKISRQQNTSIIGVTWKPEDGRGAAFRRKFMAEKRRRIAQAGSPRKDRKTAPTVQTCPPLRLDAFRGSEIVFERRLAFAFAAAAAELRSARIIEGEHGEDLRGGGFEVGGEPLHPAAEIRVPGERHDAHDEAAGRADERLRDALASIIGLDVAMSVASAPKEWIMPETVPSSPTIGAMVPTSAR